MSTQALTNWVIYDPDTLESLGQHHDRDEAFAIAETKIILGEREHVSVSEVGNAQNRWTAILTHVEGEPSQVVVIHDPPEAP